LAQVANQKGVDVRGGVFIAPPGADHSTYKYILFTFNYNNICIMYRTSIAKRYICENDDISLDNIGEGEGSRLSANLSLDQKLLVLSSDYNM
jgi:hypothetical protein